MSRSQGYRETQSAIVPRTVLLASSLVICVLAAVLPMPWLARIAMLLVAAFEGFLAWNLWSMTVEVGAGAVRVSFGPGFFHRSYPVHKIANASAAEVAWYGRHGIHVGMSKTTMMLSGRSAVLLELEGGRRVIVGSADPGRLVSAIAAEKARS